MKKVLILEGSPRPNGNSCILSEEFARGAQEAGCSVEKVMVARKKLSGCLGVNAMEAGDIRKTDAMKRAYEMGRGI